MRPQIAAVSIAAVLASTLAFGLPARYAADPDLPPTGAPGSGSAPLAAADSRSVPVVAADSRSVPVVAADSGSPWAASVSTDPIDFQIDPRHSAVEFRVRHLGISRVTGRFESFEGTFSYDPDDVTNSSVSVTINATSINTGVQRRDDHLRSADFLDVENHPTITFESTAVRLADSEHLEIVGDLMIRGTTKSVVLETEFLGLVPRRGGQTSAFSASTRINRHEYGLVWNNLQEGLQIVGDDVDIMIEVEANTPQER